MQLRYVFSELKQGLRRNLSMHIAVVLTLCVSLALVGMGVMLNQQAVKATKHWGSQLQITLYLCKANDDNPSCTGEVTDAERSEIEKVVEASPEVAGYRLESKEVAFEKTKELIGPEKFEGPHPAATVDDMRESVWIELKDPEKYMGIISAVRGLDGVSSVRDQRDVVQPMIDAMKEMRKWSWVTAGLLVVAALLLVANTIRLAAFARRKEIGIMRLVGASTLYIALPFLLEAFVTALLGVVLALGSLAAVMQFGVKQRLAEHLGFIPWIDWPDAFYAMGVVAILGPLLTVIPTLVLTRKYLKV